MVQVVFDSEFEVSNAAKDAAANGILCNQAEEPLDQVCPGRGRGGKVQVEPRVPLEPGPHFGMLMGGIVIDHQMQVEPFGSVPVDRSQKAQEFLVTMPWHALANDLSGRNIERGEQSCRSVTLVVMRHRAGAALLHRQARLGAVEGLNLA